ncbi:hypothetical protein DPMN_094622 [Dreissena polymorpha]|uniref:Uncharacterized protein n=1 Tax=Dreissena polymorpha TaxID=45954 RepID=A0A9D4L6F3_DREPO|nr:hypothetical protein DPMN_094622 [Dreissena polymorpha]
MFDQLATVTRPVGKQALGYKVAYKRDRKAFGIATDTWLTLAEYHIDWRQSKIGASM